MVAVERKGKQNTKAILKSINKRIRTLLRKGMGTQEESLDLTWDFLSGTQGFPATEF